MQATNIPDHHRPTGPLEGLRILDLTRLYPGPLATMLAAQMGAEVIKIEDPQKLDPIRSHPPFVNGQSAGHLALNAHKKSLALKLRSQEGKAIFLELVKKADVVMEGFRPGAMAAAGLDYETVKQANSRIIYVSITGYGQTGPYANRAGHDLNYIGYAGVLGSTGSPDAITMPGPQLADVAGGGYTALNGMLAALYARERTGQGQYVDVAMLDGALPLMTLQLANQWAHEKPPGRGERLLSGGAACYSVYRCACGGYLALGALEPKFWAAFCQWVKRPQWVSRQFEQELKNEVAAIFMEKTRDQWMDQTQDQDFCLSPVLELDEIEKDPQIAARKMIQTHASGHKTLGCPVKFSATPTSRQINPAPQPGAHTQTLLQALGYDPKDLKTLRKADIIN